MDMSRGNSQVKGQGLAIISDNSDESQRPNHVIWLCFMEPNTSVFGFLYWYRDIHPASIDTPSSPFF